MAFIEFDPSQFPRRISFDDLPDTPVITELKMRPQWVSWKYLETRDKDGRPKWTKPPVCPHASFGASVSNPKTWGTYAAAVEKTLRANLSGIGYVLTEQDDFSGADLDDVRDPETGTLEDWVQQIVDLAESYIEISPSGQGLRMLWRGKVAATFKCDPVHVEVYRSQRYLTITGDHVEGTPVEILPAPKTEALLRARVAAFTAQQEKKSANEKPKMVSERIEPPSNLPSEFFRKVNEAALGDLSAWVSSVFAGAKYQPGTKAYRISSRQLNRDLEEDLSIAPNGIIDFGVHDLGDARHGKRTAIDIVIDYAGAPDATRAALWLCERLGRRPADFGWQEDNGELGAKLSEQLLNSAGAIIDAPIETPSAVLNDISFGPPVDWTKPKGLIADISEWILQSSRRPNAPLAVASAVATLSAVCGRHLYGPTGSTLNVYIVCLAGTAVGKNRPLSAIGEILHAAKLPQLHTTAKGFSVSAIEQMVVDHPCCVATVDEIGANLLGRMSHKNSNTHELAMRGALLELWSREQGMPPFATHHRASSQSESIPNPSLSLFGVSTPEAFYGAITTGSVKDGFLNRFLLAQAAPRAKPQEVSEGVRRVPDRLVGAILDLIPDGKGDAERVLGVFSRNVEPEGQRVHWDGPETQQRAAQFEESILALMDAHAEQSTLLGRIYEYSVRLAALHAVSRAGRLARVTLSDMGWGASWALQSARTMIDGTLSMMASNDYEQKFNAVRNAIEQAGKITKQDLLRKIRSISARERDQIIQHLKDANWVRECKIETKGRTAFGWRWASKEP